METIREKLRELWPYLAVVAFLLIAGAALKYLPEMQVPKEAYWLDTKTIFDMKNEALRTIAYIIGGLLAVIGIILTFRRIRALEQQVQIAQEGQITERFTRGIEQLGSQEMAIRLGGIYALERIAKDSDKDYWSIMETLTAYVRERAPWKGQSQNENMEEFIDEREVAKGPFPWERPKIKPTTDIQAVLTILGRRKYHFGHGESQPIDLCGTDLRGAYLMETNLEGANLSSAHLEGATLTKAHLGEVYLSAAHLEGAYLGGAHLEEAKLWGAHLEGAYLTVAHLQRAYLAGAHLEWTILTQADLEAAILWEAHLEGTSLYLANLKGADLKGTDLKKADPGDFLGGATGLTRKQLAEAILDYNTILPDYLKEKRSGGEGPDGGQEE